MIGSRGLLALFVALPLLGADGSATGPSGAGATFPLPLYQAWIAAYRQQSGVAVNYEAVGSGNGIKQLAAGRVDFAASDIPLEPKALQAADILQFPLVVGGVVPIIPMETASTAPIRVTGAVLAGIFSGRIKRWNESDVVRLNPGMALPDQPITVVHRTDASGTTFLLTHYLSEVSPAWRDDIGTDSVAHWPVGLGVKGNEGMAALVRQTPGAIGYVEFNYAQRDGLSILSVQNAEGAYPSPGRKSFQAAATNADWEHAPGYSLALTGQPGVDSWPITGASFILMRRHPDRVPEARRLRAFLDWAYRDGNGLAERYNYAPLPEAVVARFALEWPALPDSREDVKVPSRPRY